MDCVITVEHIAGSAD